MTIYKKNASVAVCAGKEKALIQDKKIDQLLPRPA